MNFRAQTRDKNADQLIADLRRKLDAGERLEKQDLVPLTLCPLMGGEMPQKERIKAAYKITHGAMHVPKEDIRKIEAVIYAMADKFLAGMDLEEIMEDISMTRLGQMLVDRGMEQGIKALIQTCQDFGASKEDTIERILQSFEMTAERAMNYVQKYWK